MSLNIDRSNTDPFYRYKMPPIIAKVEGKGNGIKTVITNMSEVAKALARPPTYPTKFFGCELGAQTQFDAKNDRYIVNGSHKEDKLQDLLDGFIKKFVLCPGCSNPETNLVVQVKRGTINQRCIACGYNGVVDMRHKLTTFILKNPADQDANATTPAKSKKHGKKDKNNKKEDEEKDRASPEANKPSYTAQEEMAAMRESGNAMTVPTKQDGQFDEEDWGDDFSEEAVKQRMDELSIAAKGLAFTNDLEKTSKERLNMVYEMIKIKRDDDALGKAAAIKELYGEAERLEVKEKVTLILVELLLNTNALMQIKKYKSLFLKFCYENPKAQKNLLGGIELLVGREYRDALLSKTSHILNLIYNNDIVDETVFLEWAKKPSDKYLKKDECVQVHKEAQKFITWLQEAEEETDDDDEEDEDNEVIYSKDQKVGVIEVEPIKPTSTMNGNGKLADEEDEDEIDIDDI